MVSNLVSNALESHARVFPVLTEAQINRIQPFASLRHVNDGDVLFRADDSAVPFFILLSGSMEIVQPDVNVERLVANHGPGEFTGEMTMITGHRSLVCGRMTSVGDVLEMSGSGLRTLVARDGELSEIFMRAFILRRLILINRSQGNVILTGSRYSAKTLRLREFLTRNGHPYVYVDLDVDQQSPQQKEDMAMANASNTTALTQFIQTNLEKYAYRRFGKGNGLPLLCLQHFTGTLDNWDPAVIDPLALGREVILFESAGLGRSTGQVPENMAGMAAHALAFVDALGLKRLDILGYSLGGMVAQQVALERPSLVHKMLLVATAPEGGEDIMHMEKPELRKITEDPNLPGLEKLVKLFFAPSESSQAAGEAFAARLAERKQDGEPLAGQDVAIAQITAFRAWEQYSGERFAKLGKITQPCLVVNGVFDNMIPVRNSYMLSEHLPNAMLLTYPNAGHGSLFQFHKSFVRQASLFLDSEDIS